MNVKKRDGSIVEFDESRIYNAVLKAYKEVYGDDIEVVSDGDFKTVIDFINTDIKRINKNCISVEEIQDIVEDNLMSLNHQVAKAYITYRYKHTLARNEYDELMQEVKIKLNAEDVQNQNANVDEKSFGGRIGEMSDMVMKRYALDCCMSKMAKTNHLENRVYIHDLGHYAIGDHNCLTIPFDDLLANGFNTRQVDIRPAKSINTAFQLLAVIFQIQSLQQFGGVSASHLDWTMIPYVRMSFYKHFKDGTYYLSTPKFNKAFNSNVIYNTLINNPNISINNNEFYDYIKSQTNIDDEDNFDAVYHYAYDMTVKELHQAVEGLLHNLNSLQSRSGNQLPFSSVNTGTCTLLEGRLVTKALIDSFIKGVGKLHKTSIFPCFIFQCMTGVNRKPSDPNYDLYRLALKATSLRLYPNYANIDWGGNAGYDRNDPRTFFNTMGCRTANGWDINGFKQLKDGRGNICPVTIIMPTVAMEAIDGIVSSKFLTKEDCENARVDAFIEKLDKTIHEAKDMLIERFEWICSQSPDSAKFMYENNVMAGYIPEEGIRSALRHGTLALGQLGLAETLQILIGTDHTTEKGMELAKRIESLFKKRCAEFKEENKLNFGVYYSPAENLCYTAMKKFKAKYGEIPNVSDRDYFTNSMHCPVWAKLTPFEKIDVESQLTGYSSAGCITYVELPETAKNNIDALEEIVNYAMDKDIPYFAINVPNDTCEECGYTSEINDVCPQCGSSNIKRLRRVTGLSNNR